MAKTSSGQGNEHGWLVSMSSMHEDGNAHEGQTLAPLGSLTLAPGSALVIDSGSRRTRIGLAGEIAPRVDFLTVITRIPGATSKDEWAIGEEGDHTDVIKKLINRPDLDESHLEVVWPLERGIEPRWTELEVIWRNMFCDKMGVKPEEHPVMIAEPPLCPQGLRQNFCNLILKTFKCPRLFMASEPVMALFSTQKVDGLVVQVGKSMTYAVPVYHGCYLPFATVGTPVAGTDITRHLETLLEEAGHVFKGKIDQAEVVNIKETRCYLKTSLEPGEDPNDAEYEHTWVGSGQVTKLKKELWLAPEVLFKPAIVGSDAKGIQDITAQSVLTVDLEMRHDLLTHIIITGGTAAIPNFSARLRNELQAKGAQQQPKDRWRSPKAHHLPDAAWQGGSVLADIQFTDMWVTQEEYEEHGSSIVQRKCF